LVETTGAVGAAIASGVALGLVADLKSATRTAGRVVKTYFPTQNSAAMQLYQSAYDLWLKHLNSKMTQ
jgi:ribulose kinase